MVPPLKQTAGMAMNSDMPTLLETAREQMQQLFKSRTTPTRATQDTSRAGASWPLSERSNISSSGTLKHSAESCSGSGNGSGRGSGSGISASSSHGAVPHTDKDPATIGSAMEGDGWEGSDGADAATAGTQAQEVGSVHSHGCAVEGLEDSLASPHSMAAGLKLLLGSEPAELEALLRAQRVAVQSRTVAGLAHVERLSAAASLGLAFLAIAALAWGHGLATLACVFRLWKCAEPHRPSSCLSLPRLSDRITRLLASVWRERGSDLVAATCLTLLALRWALPRLRALPDHYADLRQMLADLHASVNYVNAMHADTHAIRSIMEKMSADLESKTTWIPTGVKPPAWLAGKK